MLKRWALTFALVLSIPAGFVQAQSIPNWTAPASWAASANPAASGYRSAMSASNPLPFVGITPCRLADTRGNGFTGQYGPPSLVQGVPRSFTLAGQCGVPSAAGAISLNVTVTNTAGPGFILMYPQGGSQPLVSTLNYIAGQTVANAAVVPLGGGGVTVIAGVSGTDLILDTNGYYYDDAAGNHLLNSGQQLAMEGNDPGGSIFYGLNDATGAGSSGAVFATASGAANSAGVVGQTVSGSGSASGVWGMTLSSSLNGAGVRGWALPPNLGSLSFDLAGVRGESAAGTGLIGISNSTGAAGYLLNGSGSLRAAGYLGTTSQNIPFGVIGYLLSGAGDSAGVAGVNGTGVPVGLPSGFSTAGVRGEGDQGSGVLGISGSIGVAGIGLSTGSIVGAGFLGYPPSWGVWADTGGIGCNGCLKNFVEPHPTEPAKIVRFVSLEGNEPGTYFRGTARTVHGSAVIPVPEDFRFVTEEDGLTVQLTPVGELAVIAVVHRDLNRIVVQSSKDVTFDYFVHGIHRGYADYRAIIESPVYMPESADARLKASWPEHVKRRLIANGTYNEDGTVNLVTAERLGWTRIWHDREQTAKAAAARSPAQAR